MKLFSLIFTFLFFGLTTTAQAIFWTGGSSQHWGDPDNWDPKTIPGPNDDVFFLSNTTGTIIYDMPTSSIRSIRMFGSINLIIDKGATLEIENNQNYFSSAIRIEPNNSITNRGNLFFSSLDGFGLVVKGTFVNEKTGLIEFKKIDNTDLIINGGNFTNHGIIHLFNGNVGNGIIIENNASVINTGGIKIDKGHPGELVVKGFSNVLNSGIMDFSLIKDRPMRIHSGGSFVNHSDGILKIKAYTSGFETMRIFLGGVFENAGSVDFQNESMNLSPINGIELSSNTSNNSFVNQKGGTLNIQGYSTGISIDNGAKFNNFGHTNIIDGIINGITNSGSFNNHGTLGLSGPTRFVNNISGNLNNDGGVITESGISSSSLVLFQNSGNIVNKVCSDIIGKNSIIMSSSGTIKNFGYLACLEDGVSFGIPNHLFNYGIINDPYDRFLNIFDNQGVYINVLHNLDGDFFFELDHDVANTNDFEIHLNWYSQLPLINANLIGTYDQPSNELWLFNSYSLNPLEYYYTTVTHLPSGCEKIVKIRVNPSVLPPSASALPPSSDLIDKQEIHNHSSSMIELSVFPNPSAGNFVLQFPENRKGELEVRILDFQGRVVGEYQKTEPTSLSIDLKGQLPSGMYFLQVSQQGKVIGTERVVVEGGNGKQITPSSRF